MSGTFQSSNYVPGVSGWKLDQATGDFEINSCTLGSAANAPERQMVSVEVASWSKYDLPKNAANLLQFMQAELERVPEQYRHAAEFEEFDASYGDESFNSRLFLSYARLETEEELADRLAKAKVGDGVTYVSKAFVDDGSITKTEVGDSESPKPRAGFYRPIPGVFVDADGRVCVKRDDAASDGGVDSKLAANWSLKMQVSDSGQYVVAGIGLGLPSQFLVSADRFAINDRSASDILRNIAGKIGETKLGQDLKEQVDLLGSSLACQVKELLRKELMPGGLLHRSR